jgi:hypothetical protein
VDKARQEPKAQMIDLWQMWLALVDRYRIRALKVNKA